MRSVAISALLIFWTVVAHAQEPEWRQWRGARGDGSSKALEVPTTWSDSENIAWKRPLPGRGHGSPTVLGNRVFLATAESDAETQSVHAFDRKTGEVVWSRLVHRGGFKNRSPRQANERASLASATIATDGERLFVNFLNDSQVWVHALTLSGEVIWQTPIGSYTIHQGYGSSPHLYRSLVIVSADNKAGGVVAALDCSTGKVVWKHERPEKPNYSSPIVHRIDGRDQLILTGCDLVTSLDPNTGKLLWEVNGATTECVTTPVSDGTRIFSSGGYPKNHIAAYDAARDGAPVWEQNLRGYVPSMLHADGFLFATLDAGVAICIDSTTGEIAWRQRLGGNFSSSPVRVNDVIYVTSEAGVTHLFQADPKRFKSLGKNRLGTNIFATPTYVDGEIFMRIAESKGEAREEFLVCIRDLNSEQ